MSETQTIGMEPDVNAVRSHLLQEILRRRHDCSNRSQKPPHQPRPPCGELRQVSTMERQNEKFAANAPNDTHHDCPKNGRAAVDIDECDRTYRTTPPDDHQHIPQ